MARRTWVVTLAGALLVGTAALLYERTLPFYESVGANGKAVYTPPRTEVLGVVLSPTEAVVWSIVLGALAGALLGLLVARVTRRG